MPQERNGKAANNTPARKKKPTVHTNDTGGTWIDPRELFKTEQGRRAIEKMIGSPSTKKPQKKQV